MGAALVRRLMGRLSVGHLHLTLPDGHVIETPEGRGGPRAVVIIRRWRAVLALVAAGDLGLAEAYLRGDWDSPDLVALLGLGAVNQARGTQFRGWLPQRLICALIHAGHRNTRRGSRRNIEAHYDLGNNFYAAWLDRGMSYSSALYTSPTQSLDEAQTAKQDRILARLAPAPGARVLEIGSGWGGLAERLAQAGHDVTGVTISPSQWRYATDRIAQAGLSARCTFLLQDYRDVEARFDAIVSIEMLEAVGVAFWPVYFATLKARLAPGGTALLQVITIAEDRYDAYRRTPDFIQMHIFPGGMLPSVPVLREQIAQAGLLLDHEERFGASYATTLQVWAQRFEAAWPDLESARFDAAFRRKWRYYLAYCEAGFRTGALDVGLYRMTRPLDGDAA